MCSNFSKLQKNIQKDTCWTLSNIAAGPHDHIQMMFDQEIYCGLFMKIVNLAKHGSHEVRKEALYALAHTAEHGNDKQLRLLMGICRAMDVLVDALVPSTDVALLKQLLETLEKIFQRTMRDELTYSDHFAERGGLDPLEELQAHPSDEIYKLSIGLIDKFFSGDKEEPDQNIAPEPMEEGFAFGITKELFPASPVPYSFFGFSTDNREL